MIFIEVPVVTTWINHELECFKLFIVCLSVNVHLNSLLFISFHFINDLMEQWYK